MTQPTIMIGLGAANSGTTWLNRYFNGHPQCHFRAVEELQYFNAFDWGPEVWALKRKRLAVLKADLIRQAETPGASSGVLAENIRMLADVEHYTDLMQMGVEDHDAYLGYLLDGRDDAPVVGELTPAYSLLSEDRLRTMARMADDVRFVYLLRDPVDRLWSHVRMIARSRCKNPGEFADRARNIFARVFRRQEDHILERSDYEGALKRMTAAIEPKNLCVEVYEDLFAGNALSQICAFLGIGNSAARPEKVVTAGRPLAMTTSQWSQARDWLAPQYEAVQKHFGQLPPAWVFDDARIA